MTLSARREARTVRRAARYLDRRAPGWAARVDYDRLRMWSSRDCVLGQLYGEYGDGLLALYPTIAVSGWWRGERAFDGDVPRRLWRVELERRLGDRPAVAADSDRDLVGSAS